MSDDYLWNPSAEQDPEIERLEATLRPLSYRPETFDEFRPASEAPQVAPSLGRRWVPLLAAAAVALIAIATWGSFRQPAQPQTTAIGADLPWTAEPLQGTPMVSARRLESPARIGVDEWLETDATSSVRLQSSDVGMVDIGPATRLRLTAAGEGQHRFRLERGTLHASIWAPPGRFFVDTPSATAVDLGCAYTLEVAETGAGTLRVTSGWVGLEWRGLRSMVPAGAACLLWPGRGPGIPRFEDATAGLVSALDDLDARPTSVDLVKLDTVLAEARSRDALTLWHLLERVDRRSAERVYERLSKLAPPPPGASRPAVLARDQAALEAWWNSFGFGDASLFRMLTDRR